MHVPFQSFTELVMNARKDKDYRLRLVDVRAGATIIAVHGGGIEPLTSELASAIAGAEYNLYDLQGIRPSGNEELRIPVARFDEVRLRSLVKRSEAAIHIDGSPDQTREVHIGGSNRRLKRILTERLAPAGFCVSGPMTPGAAHDPSRFYNLAAAGGVHIELSEGLRREMVSCPLTGFAWQNASQWGDLLYRFVDAIRAGLQDYHLETRSDLDAALTRFEAATATFPPSLRRPRRCGAASAPSQR